MRYRPDPEEFLDRLARLPGVGDQIVFRCRIEGKAAAYASHAGVLSPASVAALAEQGISRLYSHQVTAIELVLAGGDAVVVTPTASGKTLIYNLIALETARRKPAANALYLFPFKALARDQLKTLRNFAAHFGVEPQEFAEVYDGDTSAYRRRKLRVQPPRVLVTNPDMLHLGILPYHENWRTFLAALDLIVLDELHTYRGVFGSHVALVLRRLLRLCASLGAAPRIVGCSATIANPGELFQQLTGRDGEVIAGGGAPEQAKHFVILNPVASSLSLATRLFELSVAEGMKTIAFTKARKITELIHSWVTRRDPALQRRVAAYRAGFLPEERREIEQKLFDGDLLGVISTSALEAGIDVGGLDCCILAGYPGTITATRQRGGRVGRSGQEPVIFLVAGEDALDQYFVRRPELLFSSPPEAAFISPENPYILQPHLVCAAAELPLRRDELPHFPGQASQRAGELVKNGQLLLSADGSRYHAGGKAPHRDVDIRSAGENFTIHDMAGTMIGTASGVRARHECHAGAIYLHAGRSYRIVSLDLEARKAIATEGDVDYYTEPRAEKETTILNIDGRRAEGPLTVGYGPVRVIETMTGFVRKRIFGGEILDRSALDLPPLSFETTGIWLEVADPIKREIEQRGFHFMGALHAMEHAALAILPLLSLCDRFDVAGISIPRHEQLGTGAVFLYDNYPGGLGLAQSVLSHPSQLLAQTLELVSSCSCDAGCPNCIYSPRCGAGNRPLDKAGTLLLLNLLLGRIVLERQAESATAQPPDTATTVPLAQTAGAEPSPPEHEAPLPHETTAAIARPLPASVEGGLIQSARTAPAEIAVERRPSAAPANAEDGGELLPDLVVFDVETLRSAEEVGGWGNVKQMGLAVGVVYEIRTGHHLTFYESQAQALIDRLLRADLVVGFNQKRFDFTVLSGYRNVDWRPVPTLDLLEVVQKTLKHRLSLNHLAEVTLGETKSGDGLQSLAWVKQGLLDKVAAYCSKDVDITFQLFRHGVHHGFLLYRSWSGEVLRCPVNWGEYWGGLLPE